MSLDNKKVFLTGSTGMAGIAIIKRLLTDYPGISIVASYHKMPPVIKDRRLRYIKGDLRSLDECRIMIRGCDCLIMAAANAGGANFVKLFPWEHMKDNLTMNLNILEASRLEGIKRIIFIGSAVLYQEFEGSIREEGLDLNKDPHEAYYGYAWGMRFLEKICRFVHNKFGIEVIVVRLANIFGPYAKFNPTTSNFIPAIIRKAVDKMDPFEVWGFPDVVRDVIYVDDFARAISMLLDKDEIKFDIFNIGSGQMTKVGDVVEWALKYSGHNPKQIKYLHDKPTTIRFRALDCAKLKQAIGWQPNYKVEDGVKETAIWWAENKETWKK